MKMRKWYRNLSWSTIIIRCESFRVVNKRENFYYFGKFSWKSFGVSEKSRTFASAFAQKHVARLKKKEFFEKIT